MLIADCNEYRAGFCKNLCAFRSLQNKNETVRPRRLLLDYSNECGLKYLLLQKWEVRNYKDIENIIQDKSDSRHDALTSHDLQKLLKALGFVGEFHFPSKLKTTRQISVTSCNFHEYCRYSIKADKNVTSEEVVFEEEMLKISAWIQERMK